MGRNDGHVLKFSSLRSSDKSMERRDSLRSAPNNNHSSRSITRNNFTTTSNEGNLPDEVIKFLTSDCQFEMLGEEDFDAPATPGTATEVGGPFTNDKANKKEAQPCAPALHVMKNPHGTRKEQSQKSKSAGSSRDSSPTPQAPALGRQSNVTRNGRNVYPGAYNCTVQDDSITMRDEEEELLIMQQDYYQDDVVSRSVGEDVTSERSLMAASAEHSRAPPVVAGTTRQMIANTTCITAQLVESDEENDNNAPWKQEVDRLKRELEALKQNQSQIVLAEPLSASNVQMMAAQDAEVCPMMSNQNELLDQAKEEPNLRFTTSIYGREAELAQLKQALQDVTTAASSSSSKKQLVLISGGSGVGKSVLAQELAKTEDCHYLGGKFDLQKREQPYSAIGDACDQLCRDLLLHKNNGPNAPYPYQEFRSRIHKLLDENDTDLLQTIIPSLTRLVGESASTHDISYMEVKHRFQHAFKRFVKLLTSFDAPLVLVLDDLQWVDQPSLDLLTGLLTDMDVPNFLLIACYRDQEVTETHAFSKAVENWKDIGQLNVTRIPVNNLTEEQVCTLLQDLLSSSPEDTMELAQCVHSKTAGNPFYMKQFVLSLLSQRLLSFSEEKQGWQYDVHQLHDVAMATDNVVALLTEKLQKLPVVVQTVLPRIACLGSRFDRRIAQIVMGCYAASQDEDDTDILVTCVKEGLIVDCGPGWFKWEHDKVMEAASLLITREGEGRFDALKSEMGWLLLDQLPSEELSSHLFAVTNLLNAGTKWQHNPRIAELVGLNLRSGKTAFEASAFESAGQFLKHGIDLLPEDKWESQLELSLEMYSTAAEAHYCSGEFQQSLKYCEEVLSLTCCDLVSKKRAYNVRMHVLAAQGQVSEAIALVKQILKKLGCKFPRFGRGISAMAGFIRTAMSVDKTTGKLDRLLPVEDESKKWAIYLIDRLAHWTYLCEPSLTPLAIVRGLDWTVKYGRTDITSPILATIALILAGSVGDFDGGRKYAELAIKYMGSSVASRTLFLCYQFVFHYQLPTKSCLPYLEKSYETGMKTGDVDSAFWASYCVLEAQLHTGSSLPQLLEDCALFSRRTASHNQEMIGWSVQPCQQLVANLINKDSNKHILTGEHMDEDEFEKKIAEHAHYHHQLSRYKICAAFWFNEHEIVVKIMEEFDYHNFSIEKATPGTNGIGSLYFQCAMSCVALAHKEEKERAVHKNRAKKFLTKLKEWVNKGNPNVQHYESLLEAELSSLSGRPCIVTAKHYDYAILLSNQHELFNDHGLAHERFGDHCQRNGDETGARRHYELAIESYKRWGALAKVAMIQDVMFQE